MPMKLLRHVLLALALLTGQWLALAHAAEHSSLAPDVHCQICAHAPGVDSGVAATTPPTLHFAGLHEAPPAAPAPMARIAALRDRHIRGPPLPLSRI